MKRIKKIIIIVIGIFVAVVYLPGRSFSKELPVIEKAKDFELINQEGQKVRLSQLGEKVVLMSFSYIRCNKQMACPLTAKNFQEVQESLGELNKDTVFLIITIDPESDTPEALKGFGELYGADFKNWYFLTGSGEALGKVWKDYSIIREKQEDGSIRHSVISLLIDRNNNLRKMYFANEWKPEDVKDDIAYLINEKEEATDSPSLQSSHSLKEKFFEIKAKKFSYTPNVIKVNKGDLVRIRLISEDVHHGFFLDGYGVRTSAYPGQDGSVKFIADKTGRFSFRCSVTCGEFHPYMVGYLIVGPNSRFIVYLLVTIAIAFGSLLLVVLRKDRDNAPG